MITFVKRFLTKEAVFERVMRSVLLGAGAVAATGEFSWPQVLIALAGAVHAGDANKD